MLQRVREHRERQLELELGGSAGQRQTAVLTAALQTLADQRRLPDARLTGEVERPALTISQRTDQTLDNAELGLATHESVYPHEQCTT
jgi:hypothetical protein